MLRPGQLVRLKRRKILWTSDMSIWPTSHPNLLFELARLGEGTVVMYISHTVENVFVLYKNIKGRFHLYGLKESELLEILEPID